MFYQFGNENYSFLSDFRPRFHYHVARVVDVASICFPSSFSFYFSLSISPSFTLVSASHKRKRGRFLRFLRFFFLVRMLQRVRTVSPVCRLVYLCIYLSQYVYVCMYACVRACVRVCICVCVCKYECVCVCLTSSLRYENRGKCRIISIHGYKRIKPVFLSIVSHIANGHRRRR